ncbi:hypothetical protein CWB73_04580 [Pseudoalteromonas phenolica]|uniref:Uncharacterized protein n=1 Tax=Pseudoalteromonas phenolica TaxID=161398 RepID=A0A5S3YYF9_9GAMM|nr:hypothetical protein [Pseudoalteromonas phenolica]TMP82579.1 hypothetical protein CWB73_04580 [Pseudoalteromonas phenolica]
MSVVDECNSFFKMIYEFSTIFEFIYISFQIMIVLVFMGVFTYIPLKFFPGKYKFFLLLPLAYFIFVLCELHKGIVQVNVYKNMIENNRVSSVKGRLIATYQQDNRNYYKPPTDAAALAEVLEFEGFTLESIRPINHIAEFGCFNGSLKSKLEHYIGEEVEIVYVDKLYENATLPTLCILKIEIK